MKKLTVIFGLSLWFGPLVALAQEAPMEILREAHQAYLKGQYKKATRGYDTLLSGGWNNGHLHFNLGNSYLQQGDLAQAIWHYLRARTLLPRDEDVEANLAYAIRETEDVLDWQRPHPASAVLFWLEDFTLQEHLMGLAWINLALWLVLGLALMRGQPANGMLVRMILGVLMVGIFSTGARWHLEKTSNWGVVAVKTLEVVSGEKQEPTTLFQLHEGAIVTLLQKRERWVEIELPDGKRGWAPRDQLLT